MFKKFFTYQVLLILFLCFVILILYGALLRHHFLGGKRFHFLQQTAVFLSELPVRVRHMSSSMSININLPPKLKKHIKKKNLSSLFQTREIIYWFCLDMIII